MEKSDEFLSSAMIRRWYFWPYFDCSVCHEPRYLGFTFPGNCPRRVTKQIYSEHFGLTDEETNIASCILIKGGKNQREICWTNIALLIFIQVTSYDKPYSICAPLGIPWTLRELLKIEVRGRLLRKLSPNRRDLQCRPVYALWLES
jgi:hypothetical protein